MPLNIKDDSIHEQARELALLTGESLTSAVGQAISEKLANVKSQKQKRGSERSAHRLLALARLFAEHSIKGSHSSDHAMLYGEDGLPQ